MAAIADTSFNLTGSGDPERLEGRRVSANMFPLLGVEPQIGRVFTAAEDQPGAQRVVLLSYALWQRRFGGDPGIVGQSLTLNGESHVVVGVMPARFQFPSSDDQAWVPIALHSAGGWKPRPALSIRRWRGSSPASRWPRRKVR